MKHWTRRQFLGGLAGLAGLAGAVPFAAPPNLLGQEKPAADRPLPRRKLGKTGLEVTIIGLGGWHLGSIGDQKHATALVRRAYDLGINFFDCAWNYHDGRSETFLGAALNGIRDEVWVMTKSEERTRGGAARQIDESLKRLRTDRIDLWQFHAIDSPQDAASIFARGGAMEAAEKALRDGKILHIGVTGHTDPAAHLLALDDPRIEAIQMPLNPIDFHYESFQKEPLAKAREKGVGVIAMKTLSFGNALTENLYTVAEAFRYVWALEPDVLVSGVTSLEQLEENVALAKSSTPMPERERRALLDRVRDRAGTDVEWYKKKV
jgi:aryl-alcohol dehydrogenase-like predicted oxidoreductase